MSLLQQACDFIVLHPKVVSVDQWWRKPTRYLTHSHYPDTEQTSPRSILLMSGSMLGGDKYQFSKSMFWLGQCWFVYLLFYVLATSKVIWGWVSICKSARCVVKCVVKIKAKCKSMFVVLRHSNSILVKSWQWYDVWDEMRRKSEPTLLPTQGIFNLLHHVGMVWEELAFDDAVSYAQQGNGLQHS